MAQKILDGLPRFALSITPRKIDNIGIGLPVAFLPLGNLIGDKKSGFIWAIRTQNLC